MNLDHVFIDLALSDVDPVKGSIVGIAAIRTDYRGRVLTGPDGVKAGFSEKIAPAGSDDSRGSDVDPDAVPFKAAYQDLRDQILTPYDKSYILIAHHADVDRTFLRLAAKAAKIEVFPGRLAGMIDTMQLVWPFAFHDMVTSRDFDSICRAFGIQNAAPDTAMGDCEALSRLYWCMMGRFEYALKGEAAVRDVIGEPLAAIKSMIGL